MCFSNAGEQFEIRTCKLGQVTFVDCVSIVVKSLKEDCQWSATRLCDGLCHRLCLPVCPTVWMDGWMRECMCVCLLTVVPRFLSPVSCHATKKYHYREVFPISI